MKLKREGFFSDTDAQKRALFGKVCSKNGSKLIQSNTEYIHYFSNAFKVPVEVFYKTDFLENKVLQNILPFCKHIDPTIDITGQATWDVESFRNGTSTFTFSFPSLTDIQLQEIVKAYNEKYKPIAMLSKEFYLLHYDSDDLWLLKPNCLKHKGIVFNKERFCSQIVFDLLNLAENGETNNPASSLIGI